MRSYVNSQQSCKTSYGGFKRDHCDDIRTNCRRERPMDYRAHWWFACLWTACASTCCWSCTAAVIRFPRQGICTTHSVWLTEDALVGATSGYSCSSPPSLRAIILDIDCWNYYINFRSSLCRQCVWELMQFVVSVTIECGEWRPNILIPQVGTRYTLANNTHTNRHQHWSRIIFDPLGSTVELCPRPSYTFFKVCSSLLYREQVCIHSLEDAKAIP